MQNLSSINVTKASGEKEAYSEEKIIRSLAKSGLSLDTANQTVDYLKHYLKSETSTAVIYNHISSYLKENASLENYFNYSLKRAVMELGPSGYPFEILVADLLSLENFKTKVGVINQGKCVTHEIDITATKDKERYYVECKFHNTPGFKTDIQVALYTYARFLDIDNIKRDVEPNITNHSWLITNTKVTSEVIDYSKCVGQLVTTWNRPQGQGLQDRIVFAGLHPITLIYNIPQSKIKALLDRDIVTCVRLKAAILNNQVDDILSKIETDSILKNIANVCK